MKGYIDKTGRLAFVLDVHVSSAKDFHDGLAAVYVDGKGWGYIDKKGHFVIGPQQGIGSDDFSEGLALFCKDSTIGYIDRIGKEVIPHKFVGYDNFSEGLARVYRYVREKEKFWGFINKSGQLVIDYRFEDAWPFKNGLACVRYNGLWGIIDKTGYFVIEPKYEKNGNFHDGLAVIKSGGKWAFIDKKENIVLQLEQNLEGVDSFNDGLARVRYYGQWGYIDKSGQFAIKPKYSFASTFEDGLAWVASWDQNGLIDTSGRLIVDYKQFDGVGYFYEGLAYVKMGDKYGYINKKGEMVIKPTFLTAGDFHEGLACVEVPSEHIIQTRPIMPQNIQPHQPLQHPIPIRKTNTTAPKAETKNNDSVSCFAIVIKVILIIMIGFIIYYIIIHGEVDIDSLIAKLQSILRELGFIL